MACVECKCETNDQLDFSKVEAILTKHGKSRGALIPILQETQGAYGYLPKPVLKRIAKTTRTIPSQVYGVVTFYSQFRLKPSGKHIIRVCHGTACHVSGAEAISETVSEELVVKEGETTSDGKFTLESVACLGCCSLAPVMMIGEEIYGRLTRREIPKILKNY